MDIVVRPLRRFSRLAVVPLIALAALGCTPEPPPVDPEPVARAVVDPTSGPAGSVVHVAPSDDSCVDDDAPTQVLEAVITVPANGVVIARAYQFMGPASPSTYASDDPFVTIQVPLTAAPGRYSVFLSCSSYLDSYEYAPTTFTVTPPL
jgi:hypothetical protein